MGKYLIAYDLDGPNETSESYRKLIERIEEYPSAKEVQRSVWVLKSDGSYKQVRDHLWELMDADDRLLVVSLDGGGAFEGDLLCSDQWLLEFLTS
jgi:hypothetical protein